MVTNLSYDGSTLRVQSAELSSKVLATFLRGTIAFEDGQTHIGKFTPMPTPANLTPATGLVLNLQLVGPDGIDRKQTRTIALRTADKNPNRFFALGQSKSLRAFSPEAGWNYVVYKFRAYMTHPGVETDGRLPDWMLASIERQRILWNFLCWSCREARRKCSSVPVEEIRDFVNGTVIPSIEAFNATALKPKDRMKHPAKLKVETPTIEAIWKYVGELHSRSEKGRPLPEGLLEQSVGFVSAHKSDFTHLREFLAGYRALAEAKAAELRMKLWESKPTITAFAAAISARRAKAASFTDGWPQIKYPDSPRAGDWGIHFPLNAAGVPLSNLETLGGVTGLAFDKPVAARTSGHPSLSGNRSARRRLRQAAISIRGNDGERWNFTFAVLQHRELSQNSHIKKWALIHKEGQLWLCLTVEQKNPVAPVEELAAGLDIGWRKIGDYIRMGMLYEPKTKSFRELKVDLAASPVDTKSREPFVLALGPTRLERRGIQRELTAWDYAADGTPTVIEARQCFQQMIMKSVNDVKAQIREMLGGATPVWFEKANIRGLQKMLVNEETDSRVKLLLSEWLVEHLKRASTARFYSQRVTARIEWGQTQLANDVCKHLIAVGVHRIKIETAFLSTVASSQDNYDPEAVKHSQKYRQLIAAGKFLTLLRMIALKHGIAVVEIDAVNTTRTCHVCGHTNTSSGQLRFPCGGCGCAIEQDQNAAMNIADAPTAGSPAVTATEPTA